MPNLILGDLNDPRDDYRARCDIFAAMAWPADEDTRRRYIATVMAHSFGMLSEAARGLPDLMQAQDWIGTIDAVHDIEALENTQTQIGDWLEEAGGLLPVTTGPGIPGFEKEAASKLGGWFAAGLILALVRRMASHHPDLQGGASVNKAVFMLERVPAPMCPKNSHDLRRAWTTYKPVAHLCAALFDATIREEACPLHPGEDLYAFLADAEAYQHFGLNHVPPRAKGVPLLDSTTTWLLPEPSQWAPTRFVPAALDGRLLDAARTYRAPIPGG